MANKKKQTAADSKLWEKFKLWAVDNGISLDHKDDWENWWTCFVEGSGARLEIMQEELIETASGGRVKK